MSKLFMYGSEFQDVEQLMMLAPNFLPRKSGVIVVQRIRKEPRLLQKEKSRKRITDYCGSNLSGSLLNEIDFEHGAYEEILSRCFVMN